MGVAPWDLASQPYAWTAYALDAESIELAAQKYLDGVASRAANRAAAKNRR